MPSDTAKEIEEIYIKKLKEKTDIERALMGFSMFETARLLVKSSFDITDARGIRIALFNRFYGNDFDERTREIIIEHLTISCDK